MKKYFILSGLVLAVVVGAMVWLSAAPSIGSLVANPSSVITNTPTPVLFTIQIADPSVIPSGVNLLKVDANGRTLSVVGTMRDDGTTGDVVAGDHTFSFSASITQVTAASAYYRASAPFKGVLTRVLSGLVAVTSRTKIVEPTTGISLAPTGVQGTTFALVRKPSQQSKVSLALHLDREGATYAVVNLLVSPTRVEATTTESWARLTFDPSGVLEQSGTFMVHRRPDGRTGLLIGFIPGTYEGHLGALCEAYLLSQDGRRVLCVSRPQEETLGDGLGPAQTELLYRDILNTIDF